VFQPRLIDPHKNTNVLHESCVHVKCGGTFSTLHVAVVFHFDIGVISCAEIPLEDMDSGGAKPQSLPEWGVKYLHWSTMVLSARLQAVCIFSD